MPLDRFGFTRTQDVVYKALLRRGAATGYAISRDTKLARANVYQALDALVAGGLASARSDRPVIYTPVAAGQAIAKLAAGVERDLTTLAGELGTPAATRNSRRPRGEGFERLDGVDALVAAASAAIESAGREILAVVGPWVAPLAPVLQRARERGLACKTVSLGAPAPEGAVVRLVAEDELRGYWGGFPLLLVCDRVHAVSGVVTGDEASGVETRSPGLVPFLRHLLRREFATAAGPRA